MNKIYKVIYCKATQTFVAVSEMTKGHGKGGIFGSPRRVDSINSPFGGRLKSLTFAVLLGLGFNQQVMAAEVCNTTGTPGTAVGADSLACGTGAIARPYSVAVGQGATSRGVSVVIGRGAIGNRGQSVAIGSGNGMLVDAAVTNTQKSVAIGSASVAGTLGTSDSQSVAIGNSATATGDQSTALGANANAWGDSSLAIGGDDIDKVAIGTAVGDAYKTLTNDSTFTNGNYILTEAGHAATAVGQQTQATGALSTAFGTRANASGQFASAFGVGAKAGGEGSVAMGPNSNASGESSFSGGVSSVASGVSSVAIGNVARATVQDSVALGSSSIANRDASTAANTQAGHGGYNVLTGGWGDGGAIDSTRSTHSAVSVGNVTHNADGSVIANPTNVLRQITGVAAGTNDSDAVNVAQLKLAVGSGGGTTIINNNGGDTVNVIGELPEEAPASPRNIRTDIVNGDVVIMLAESPNFEGTVTAHGFDASGERITNVAPGRISPDSTDAVNGSQLAALYDAVGNMNANADAGTAAAMAMASLPQPSDSGANMVAAGVGAYNSESALSIGVSSISDNGKWIIKGALTHDTQDNTGAAVGVGYQW